MARLIRRAGTWLLQPCLLLVWILAAVGCNASTQQIVRATATSLPMTPTATALPTANPTPLAFNSVWGDVPIRHIAEALDTNNSFGFTSASTPDGRRVLIEIGPTNSNNSQQVPTFVGIYDLTNGSITRIHQIPSLTGFILTAAADNRYMAWLETADQNQTKWTMWLYDLQTQQVQQIGQNSTNTQGQPVSGTYPKPWISNGHLIWGQRIGEIVRPDVSNDVIKLMDLSTRQTQTIATSAGLPALAWPWVAYAQSDNKGHAVGVIKNLETSQTLQWQDVELPYLQSMAISGHGIAYSLLNGDPSSVRYIADFTQNTTPVTLISGINGTDYVDFVTMNDRLIGWNHAGTAPTQVWDRKLNRLVLLPSGSKVGATVFSTLVYWPAFTVSDEQAKQLENQGIQPPSADYIIDTTSLP